MSHAKGKLSYDAKRVEIVAIDEPRFEGADPSDGPLCVVYVRSAMAGDAEANRRRLIACWNACVGVSTEDLEENTRLIATN